MRLILIYTWYIYDDSYVTKQTITYKLHKENWNLLLGTRGMIISNVLLVIRGNIFFIIFLKS